MEIETDFGPVLNIEARPWGRGEVAFGIGFTVFVSLFGVLLAGSIFTSGRVASRVDVFAAVAAVAAALVVAGPSVLLAARQAPRGAWRLDGEGVSHSTRRGRMRRIRWKEVERVCWRSDVVKLQGGGTCVRVTLSYIDEPARSAVRAELEATLGKDFDLRSYRYPLPDAFDAFEPAWLRSMLRAARVVMLGVVIGAALAGFAYWIGTRYPEKEDDFPKMAVLGLLGCLVAASGLWIARGEERINPSWRRRRVKPPADDLAEELP